MTTAAVGPLLEVRNLRTVFPTDRGAVLAVDGVDFSVNEGETLGIVGESGSGKSVMMRTIMNLLPETAMIDTQSEIRFDGRNIRTLSKAESKHFWGKEIAMVFQDPMTSLNPVKKVGAQLTESLRYHLGLSRKAAQERALDLLNMVRIPEPRRRLNQYPHEMSGGMRQRVVIAIALACEPRLLIADEPTTALDVTVQRGVLDLLAEIQDTRGMAMILITHDLGVVAGRADRVGVMYGGQMMELADTETLFREVRHPYTAALLDSIPDLSQPSHTRLATIEGRPLNMLNLPEGCRFAPRCRHAVDACSASVPAFINLGERDRGVRCILPSAITGAADPAPQHVLSEI